MVLSDGYARTKSVLSDEGTETADEETIAQVSPQRLLVTHDGLLDPSLLLRTEGYINKKGGTINARGGFRNWKKRWFVLVPISDYLMDGSGHVGYELQYWTGPSGGRLKGTVGLADVEIYCEIKNTLTKSMKYEFQILLQNGSVLELSCDDELEREEWVETLNMVITYLRYLRRMLTAGGAYVGVMTLDGYDPLKEDDEHSYRIGDELAMNCQAYGPGIFGSEAGQQAQFVVQVHDLMGQKATRGGMPVTATISSDDCLYYLKITDSADGTYQAHYMLSAVGKYKLSISLNDEHPIFGSPFDIDILPTRTDHKNCSAEGAALESITTMMVDSFTIVARDSFGNRKQRGGDPFEVGVMGPAQLSQLQDNSDGTYTCQIEAISPHNVTYITGASLLIMVTLNGKHVKGSPFKPNIIERNVPAFQSSSSARMGTSFGLSGSPYMNAGGHNRTLGSPRQTEKQDAQLSPYRYNYDQLRVPPTTSTGAIPGDGFSPPKQSMSLPFAASSSSTESTPAPVPLSVYTPASSSPPKSPFLRSEEYSLDANALPTLSVAAASASAYAKLAESARTQLETPGGAPMSRLERARQRALLAKSMAEAGAPPIRPVSSAIIPQLPPPPPPPLSSTSQQQEQQQKQPPPLGSLRMSDLNDISNYNISNSSSNSNSSGRPAAVPANSNSTTSSSSSSSSSGGGGGNMSRLNQIAARSLQNLNKLKLDAERTGEMNKPVTPEVTLTELAAMLQAGLAGDPPANASLDEQRVWFSTHKGLPQVGALLKGSYDTLKVLFNLFAQNVEGTRVLKLTTSSNQGTYRMLELFDAVPTSISRREAKIMFSLLLHAQSNLSGERPNAGGGSGLDLTHFLKYLVMLAYHSFSKTKALTNAYPAIEDKVRGVLFEWGLADPAKVEKVRRTLEEL